MLFFRHLFFTLMGDLKKLQLDGNPVQPESQPSSLVYSYINVSHLVLQTETFRDPFTLLRKTFCNS